MKVPFFSRMRGLTKSLAKVLPKVLALCVLVAGLSLCGLGPEQQNLGKWGNLGIGTNWGIGTACAASPVSPARPVSASPAALSAHPGAPRPAQAQSWVFGEKAAALSTPITEKIWTQGVAPQALKAAAVSGLKSHALKSAVKAPPVPPVKPPEKGRLAHSPRKALAPFPPAATGAEKPEAPKKDLSAEAHATLQEQHRKSSGLPLGKHMRLRGDMENTRSSWHNSALKNAMRVDQELPREETNVIGAYADIEAGKDVTLSAGPEFSHTKSQSNGQSAALMPENAALGLGVQLKWDF